MTDILFTSNRVDGRMEGIVILRLASVVRQVKTVVWLQSCLGKCKKYCSMRLLYSLHFGLLIILTCYLDAAVLLLEWQLWLRWGIHFWSSGISCSVKHQVRYIGFPVIVRTWRLSWIVFRSFNLVITITSLWQQWCFYSSILSHLVLSEWKPGHCHPASSEHHQNPRVRCWLTASPAAL